MKNQIRHIPSWIQTLKPKSNTHPDDKFNKTTHVNNRRRTKNQTSKRGKKNVIYLRKESGRKTQLICRERGTRIKCKIDAKTNKCAYMWETEPSHNTKRWGETETERDRERERRWGEAERRRECETVNDGERGLGFFFFFIIIYRSCFILEFLLLIIW